MRGFKRRLPADQSFTTQSGKSIGEAVPPEEPNNGARLSRLKRIGAKVTVGYRIGETDPIVYWLDGKVYKIERIVDCLPLRGARRQYTIETQAGLFVLSRTEMGWILEGELIDEDNPKLASV